MNLCNLTFQTLSMQFHVSFSVNNTIFTLKHVMIKLTGIIILEMSNDLKLAFIRDAVM